MPKQPLTNEQLRALRLIRFSRAYEFQERPINVLSELSSRGLVERKPTAAAWDGRKMSLSYEISITEMGKKVADSNHLC